MKIHGLLVTGILVLTGPLVPRPAPAQNMLQQYLESHETKEKLPAEAARWVRGELNRRLPALAPSLAAADLYVTAFDDTLPTRYYLYRTANCIAVLTALPRPSIVCNAEFVAEAEMIVRAFENAGALLQEDAALLDFTRKSSKSPRRFLAQLRSDRRLAAASDQSDEHIGLHLKMALLFFVSHELGHLIDRADFQRYAETPAGDWEPRLRSAIVKTCRHAEEFNEMGFGLPLWDLLIAPGSDARKVEERLRTEVVDQYEQTKRRSAAEDRADKLATRVLVDYLKDLADRDQSTALQHGHILVETLFVIGVYTWYRDLGIFSEKACPKLDSSAGLSSCMMRARGTYIDASAVFGEVHRFVLLRSILAIGHLLRALWPESARQSMWPSKEILDGSNRDAIMLELWRSGDLQRHMFLRILMDTPVKFAYAACVSGWFLEVDRRRGTPQIFVMNFETIEQVYKRLLALP